MILANIYPIKNQKYYKEERVVMLLAHLISHYNPAYFNEDQFIILDNGIYENAQVSTDIRDLIAMADNCGIPVDELVIPDKFFDTDETIRLFESNLEAIRENSDRYSFMFVAHHNNFNDFVRIMEYINKYKDDKSLNITVGIPKKALFSRECDEAIEIYKKCPYPIHFLGVADNTPLKDLSKVQDLVRSCDTSQIVTMIKNNTENVDILSWVRKKEDTPIDLENDFIDESRIEKCIYEEFDKSIIRNFLGILD